MAIVGLGKKAISSRWAEDSRKRARESGELPHEFLLRVARGEAIEVTEFDEQSGEIKKRNYYPSFADRVDAANQCANYFAPKLTAQQVEEVNPTQELTDEELNAKIAELETGRTA